ncbi:MAG: hypothetical protein SF097_19260 [Acidobacteriota bacterium]|nr:hypothetical protein [Acidobacteriota bacterium]
MLNLKNWKQQWEAMDRANLRSLREMTIEESVKSYLSLCHSLAPFLEESRSVFLADRAAYLTELQERLRKFGEWRQQQDGTVTEST